MGWEQGAFQSRGIWCGSPKDKWLLAQHTHTEAGVKTWGRKRDYREEKGIAGFLSRTVTVRYFKNERLL